MASVVWGMTRSKELFGKFKITFLFCIATGHDQQQIPQLAAMQNVGCNNSGQNKSEHCRASFVKLLWQDTLLLL